MTQEYKIIQIIPAPLGMVSIFRTPEGKNIQAKVECLALIEQTDGHRHVSSMSLSDAEISLCLESSNYLGVEYATFIPKE